MRDFFEKNVDWKILTYFFRHPSLSEHVKSIARSLKIGAGSASRVCSELSKNDFLKKKSQGNLLLYSLNNDNAVVKHLKSTWFLNILTKFSDEWENEEFLSVALYGSCASGEFVEKSDVDILVITNMEKRKALSEFEGLRKEFGEKLALTVLSLAKWRDMASKRERFYEEVIAKHVLLRGTPIVV